MEHWVILPVVLPAFAAVLVLLAGGERLGLQRVVGLAVAVALVLLAADFVLQTADGTIHVYRLGDWPAPYGIVLVLDRLAAIMLLLGAVLGLAALAYASSGWDRRGRFFHTLFQLQLMGLNGAFLTGDLFNLFVFFEVLLAASYTLVLHGLGPERLRAGFHYVVVNLAASALFLLGIAVLYGVTGTLNMADLAVRVPDVPAGDAALLRAAALVLLAAFAVKAAVFPLYFWLPRTYTAASAGVAALFAIMTKVGLYAIVRVHGLVFGPEAGDAALLVGPWLFVGGVATAVFGTLGVLAARSLGGIAAYLTVASVGTTLFGVALFSPAGLGAAIYYMVQSALTVAALFLLAELIGAQRGEAGDRLDPAPPVAQPVLLGTLLLVAAATALGAPPFAGFLGKLAVLEATAGLPATPIVWAVVLGSGFLTLLALARAGSVLFWKTAPTPAENAGSGTSGRMTIPAIALLACAVALAVFGGPAKRFADAAGAQVTDRAAYAQAVLESTGGSHARTTRRFPPGGRP